jgi:hypothetical protein
MASIYNSKQSIYNSIQSIFTVLQEENKKNIVYTEEYNIPVSNNYYSFIIDPNDNDYKLALSKIYRNDLNESRESGGVISTGLIEEEQIYDINIINKNIKELDVLIENILQSINESSSILHLIIDIEFLLTLFKQFYDKGCEIHLIDFIIYKFKNKVDAIYIYSKNSTLNAKSILYNQITECLKDVHINININNKDIYTLYKNINNMYWYLDIKDDDDDSDIPNISIDVNISDIISNIFNKDELYVLNPCDKNKLFL